MSKFQQIKQKHDIVLVGNFNPAIFQPAWFQANDMLSESQAENAQIELIHAQAAVFELDGIKLRILPDRFSITTEQEKYDTVIRDLLLGAFSILSHTPMSMMGINRSMHYRLESTEAWHEAGHKLAPKGLWEGILEKPGMLGLSMQGEMPEHDKVREVLNVKIEPFKEAGPCLRFEVNDHYETKEKEDANGSEVLMSILNNRWEDSYQHSKSVVEKLLEQLL